MLKFIEMILVVIILSKLLQTPLARNQTFIVHMAGSEMPPEFLHHAHWYDSALKSVSESAEMIYVYKSAAHGFSAKLTEQEALFLETLPGVVSVQRERKYQLHTTRTPSFLGLVDYLLPGSAAESDVVIGVIDTGVWPEMKSFDDRGLGPVPSTWKGTCETGTNFNATNCNRKLIGARYFSKGYEASQGPVNETLESKSPRDDDGHGTHTASTAAGSPVQHAGLFGYAAGTAQGMAKNARIAAYKSCWNEGCFPSDVLAAMESAIEDGVDILSLSLGVESVDYYDDVIAVAAFAAMEKGIVVVCSAGNSGPSPYTMYNMAPWITTVGAGTLDRDFPAPVILGNGKKIAGISLYDNRVVPFAAKKLPFVYAGNVSNATNGNLCLRGTLDPNNVKGKIVLCDRGLNPRVKKGYVVKAAGGAGMVLANAAENGEELIADPHLLPATQVTKKSGDVIKSYLFSDPNPTATISFKGTKVSVKPAPVLASFSSRGPNTVTREILKPDVIAPGVSILAGWSGAASPSSLPEDPRGVEFNIILGTSMSCPHVSGIAALLKAAYPDWSPAAIRSALMTTAYVTYMSGTQLIDAATGKEATPYDYGSGHVNPMSALNPGLVYDIDTNGYLDFICTLNYTSSKIYALTRKNFSCDSNKKYSVTDLNYPSFTVVFINRTSSIKYTRTLTNVGESDTYEVYVSAPDSVEILVEPQTLSFTEMGEKKSYTVTFNALKMVAAGQSMFGRIEWSSAIQVVASPVAITWS
ncbi:unnamed protein product [Cuscuta europaea]|uniref:Subtilisin-like protease SBT1.7 n=1 Tax=Cuscuta europaea TaxID=41803 RepID=A0A9P1EK95_CUSEU|nr:unnamed protein product [Cuscuta europaea]